MKVFRAVAGRGVNDAAALIECYVVGKNAGHREWARNGC